jgi:hypothetical protein
LEYLGGTYASAYRATLTSNEYYTGKPVQVIGWHSPLTKQSFFLDLRKLVQALSFFVRTWANRKINNINMNFETY